MEKVAQYDGFDAMLAGLVARKMEALRSVARQLRLTPPAFTEADRIAEIKARARPPERCGPAIAPAPARGPMVAFAPMAMRRGAEGYALEHDGYRGRDAARQADAFDVMADQARRSGGAAPFTPEQVATGRRYAALVERHAARGVRGISAELRQGSGGGDHDGWIEAVLAEGDRIRAMQRAIGDGFALTVQRAGGKRRSIPVRALVDAVCLEGLTLTAVLRRHGWAKWGASVEALRAALDAALDRMANARG